MEEAWVRLFGTFIAAMGAWMIRIGRRNAAKSREAAKWPTTSATITKSRIKKMPGANAKFRFDVEYRYVIDAEDYRNDKMSIGGEITAGRILAEKYQATYPEGSTRTIYVNPEAPAEAYLEPLAKGIGRTELFGGIVGVLFGLLLASGYIG